MKRARATAFALALTALPTLAHACAVCGADGGRSRLAFFWTTVLLSLVPLAMFAGGLWFLRRSAGAWMRDELVEREDAVVAAPRDGAPADARAASRLATESR